jgi:nitronate monooxygenase
LNFPKLRIGDLVAKVPIIQGGMGIGVSLSGLASAVANQGGVGVIATAGIGVLGFDKETRCCAKRSGKPKRRLKVSSA